MGCSALMKLPSSLKLSVEDTVACHDRPNLSWPSACLWVYSVQQGGRGHLQRALPETAAQCQAGALQQDGLLSALLCALHHCLPNQGSSLPPIVQCAPQASCHLTSVLRAGSFHSSSKPESSLTAGVTGKSHFSQAAPRHQGC